MPAYEFNKEYATLVSHALRDRVPIVPSDGRDFSPGDIVTIAAVCYASLWMGGPPGAHSFDHAEASVADWKLMSLKSILLATNLLEHLDAGTYDKHFRESVRIEVMAPDKDGTSPARVNGIPERALPPLGTL